MSAAIKQRPDPTATPVETLPARPAEAGLRGLDLYLFDRDRRWQEAQHAANNDPRRR